MCVDKYKELFQISKEAIEFDERRCSRIEEKGSRYSSALVVAVSVTALFCKWGFDHFLPIKGCLDGYGLVSLLLLIISLGLAWFFLLRVWSIWNVTKIPLNEEMIKFFNKSDLSNIYLKISERAVKAHQKNLKYAEHKLKYLKWAGIAISLYFIILPFVLFCIGFKIYAEKRFQNSKQVGVLWETKEATTTLRK